jgi:AcrR family transcriptional regulator
MARPRRVSDEAIFGELRRAVAEQGPRVSLDVVAERLGVTAPALFRRFGSRQDLLMAALRPDERPAFLDELERGPDKRPFREQLRAHCGRIASYMASFLPCMSALRESGIPDDVVKRTFAEPPQLRALRALAGWLGRADQLGIARVDEPEVVAMALLGAVQAPVFFRHLERDNRPWDPTVAAAAIADVFYPSLNAARIRRSRTRRLQEKS